MKKNKFLLNNPEIMYLVEKGEIALFASPIKSDGSLGIKIYLCSFYPGELLLGVTPELQENFTLLAVSLKDAEFQEISAQTYEKLLELDPEKAVNLIKIWLDKLKTIYQEYITEVNYPDLDNLSDLQSVLLSLHKNLITAITQKYQEEQKEGLINLKNRQKLNQQTTVNAWESLGSLLPQEGAENLANNLFISAEYQDLYLAAYTVGKAMKIDICPPNISDNKSRIKEPLELIARASRVRIRRVILTEQWWLRDCGALLAYTREENRPVALLPINSNYYQLFDPETQIRLNVNQEIASNLQPVAYTFYRPFPESKLNLQDLLKFVLQDHKQDLFILLWTGFLITIVGMFTPLATAILIDQAIPNANQSLITELCVGLLGASLGKLIFEITQSFARIRIETLSDMATQSATWDRLLNLPLPFFREYSSGDLRARVSAISEIRSQLGGNTLETLFGCIVALPNFLLLFYYNFSLATIAIIIFTIYIFITVFIGVLSRNQTKQLQEISGNIFGLMIQLINGVGKLRVSGAESRAFAHWSKYYSLQQKIKLSIQNYTDTLTLFNQVLPTLSLVLLFNTAIVYLPGQNQGMGLSTGQFLAFNAAFGILLSAAGDFADIMIKIWYIGGLWERVKPILQTEPEVDKNKADPGKLLGRLGLENVNFSYGENKALILQNVTIHAEPGQFIAIVGPSGSGKSTIMRLLLGFEQPLSGKVYYNYHDLKELNIQAVRRQLGVVLQSSKINSGSIFDNIAGSALITIDEAWKACQMVCLADDISGMPMEMHTVISEGGGNLSGGQRQRLLIARALVLQPKILLFDEATSALDNQTQATVTESLEKLQVTRVVIAHRLTTIQKADIIYVLEAGHIVQKGSFNDLINQDGVFARLMQSQIL